MRNLILSILFISQTALSATFSVSVDGNGKVVAPSNLFTKNSTNIYNAISNLISVSATATNIPLDSAVLTTNDLGQITTVTNRTLPNWINVKDPPYNAAGDGVTDDSSAFHIACLAIASSGGTIYVPDGNYLLSATNITLPSNSRLYLSPNTIVKRGDSTAYFGIVCNSDYQTNSVGNTNITIEGGSFDLNGSGQGYIQSAHGIALIGVKGATIRNVRLINNSGDGIYISSTMDATMHTNYSSNVGIIGCYFDGASNGRNGISIIHGTDISIVGNQFLNCSTNIHPGAIDLEPDDASEFVRSVSITANTFRNCRQAVQLLGTGGGACYSVTIANNIIETTRGGGDGINCVAFNHLNILGNHVISANNFGILVSSCSISTIANNTVENCPSIGIYLLNTANASLTGNSSYGNGNDNIRIEGSPGTALSGGASRNWLAGYGLRVMLGSANCSISGVTFDGVSGTKTGISIEDTSTGNSVVGCSFRNVTTEYSSIAGNYFLVDNTFPDNVNMVGTLNPTNTLMIGSDYQMLNNKFGTWKDSSGTAERSIGVASANDLQLNTPTSGGSMLLNVRKGDQNFKLNFATNVTPFQVTSNSITANALLTTTNGFLNSGGGITNNGDGTTPGFIVLSETNGVHGIKVQARDQLSADVTYKLPGTNVIGLLYNPNSGDLRWTNSVTLGDIGATNSVVVSAGTAVMPLAVLYNSSANTLGQNTFGLYDPTQNSRGIHISYDDSGGSTFGTYVMNNADSIRANTTLTARYTSAQVIRLGLNTTGSSSGIGFYTDTSLTAGSGYTPTLRAQIDANGLSVPLAVNANSVTITNGGNATNLVLATPAVTYNLTSIPSAQSGSPATNWVVAFGGGTNTYEYMELTQTNNIFFQFSTNRAPVRTLAILLNAGANNRTNTLNSSWKRLGSLASPFTVTNGTKAILSLTCFGGGDSGGDETNVVAAVAYTFN